MLIHALNPSRYRPVWNRGLEANSLDTSLPYTTSADHWLQARAQAQARPGAEDRTDAENRAHAGHGPRAGRGELLPLGTAGIVASVAQVNDRAAAPLMLALHRRLRSAGPGPGALAAALRDARADACHAAAGGHTAGWSFIALGA